MLTADFWSSLPSVEELENAVMAPPTTSAEGTPRARMREAIGRETEV